MLTSRFQLAACCFGSGDPQAKSKRSQQQGRNLCGAAKTLHGRETRAIRAKRQQALAELKLLERMGKGVGFLRSVNRRCWCAWPMISDWNKVVLRRRWRDVGMIEDMAESIGMVASRRRGRRSR